MHFQDEAVEAVDLRRWEQVGFDEVQSIVIQALYANNFV